MRIVKGQDPENPNPEWVRLHSIWLSEKKPGHVSWRGTQWKVLTPSDDEVIFVREGGFDSSYASTSGEI